MWSYFLLFLIPAGIAFSPLKGDKYINYMLWTIVGLLCVLVIGLRYEVGVDWGNYLVYLDNVRGGELKTKILETAYGNATAYIALSWVVLQLGLGIHAVNTVCAVFFTVGLIKYCQKQPLPWVALAVAMPYVVCVVSMSITRQATALGFLLWGLSVLRAGNEGKYFALIMIGSLFHISLIITLPLIVCTREKTPWVYYPFFVFFLLGLFYLLSTLTTAAGGMNLLAGYLIIFEYTATRYSAGAAIRILLTVLPVLVALFYWKRIQMISTDFRIIKWMAIASIIAVPALILSTTLIDRFSVYLLPLQLALWSRLIAVQKTMLLRSIWASTIISFYGVVLFVFFTFAIHASYWLPYRMWPFSSETIYPPTIPM